MAENDNDLAKSLTSTDVSGSLRKATFNNLEDGTKANADFNEIDLVMDVPVQVTVELGRAKMQIRNLLNLTYGSVIELDILAGEPLEVVVNGCLVAQGEVVEFDDDVAWCQATVCDAQGRLVAKAHGSFRYLPRPQ